jgi:hypothetical protein
LTWSKISNTDLAEKAKAQYNLDPRMRYHNWGHIQNLYWAAEHMYGFEYDLDLDRAILTHDVIYDEHPLKELRSAKWLLDHCMEDGVEKSFAHIMRTAKPEVGEDNRMILLDFARLRFRDLILPDRNDFLLETMALTGVDEITFARSNLAFFQSILPNFADHHLTPLPEWERQALREIRAGMEFTVEYSQILLQDAA